MYHFSYFISLVYFPPSFPFSRQVRATLEKSILSHVPDAASPYPDYLERVTLETFRRYRELRRDTTG
jgi:hypothetical protein